MRNVWERWVPRLEDYWETFSLPHRRLVTELVDKHTPVDGSVMDFGCGAGVQAFLIRQRRPDIHLYAVDCNPQARNLTLLLLAGDDKLVVEDTAHYVETMRDVDTIISIFTCAYLLPSEIGNIMMAFTLHAQTVILAEPTTFDQSITEYAGMPTAWYAYPYSAFLKIRGWSTETTEVVRRDTLNAVTVATKGELCSS